jgi:hypothetical protein
MSHYIPATERTPTKDGVYECLIYRAHALCYWKKDRFEGIKDLSSVSWKEKVEDATELDTAA